MCTLSPETLRVGFGRGLALVVIAAALTCCSGGGGGEIPPFNLYNAIVLGDFNGDGALDMALAATFIAGPPPHPGFVTVVLQNPSAPGAFLPGVHYPVGSDPFSLAAGDLNGDGRLDLAAASTTLNVSGTTPMPITLLFQAAASPGTFQPGVGLTGGLHNEGLAVGDLNGDGRNDIAVAACSAGLLLFFQGPAGTFSAPVSLPAGTCPGAAAIGDLNNDGVADLAVATSDSAGNGRVLVLLQNPGSPGTFVSAGNLTAGLQPTALKLADINGDGFVDIAVANFGSPSDGSTASVSVLLQNPAAPGSFLPAATYVTGFRSADVAIGDLNGDGRPDLAVANWGMLGTTGSVSVLLQDPANPGVFLPARNYPGRSMPVGVAIGDLNGDGRPDIAVADDGAAVMFNDPHAPGTFLPSVLVGN